MVRHATIIDMMTTIQKTIDIPPNRMLSFELPETVPVGKTTVILSFIRQDSGQDSPSQDSGAFPTIEELKADAEAKYAARMAGGEDALVKWRDSLDHKIFNCDYSQIPPAKPGA
jgi:hypothetical protein